MLTRWDPFAEMTRLHDQLARIGGPPQAGRFVPAVDIHEDETSITLDVEVAGVKPEAIEVHVENNVLSLSGKREFENKETRDGYHRIERSYGEFTRSFALPEGVDAAAVKATTKDGVLTVSVPKTAKPDKKRIAVKAE